MPKPWNAEIRIGSQTEPENGEALEAQLRETPHLQTALEHELERTETEAKVVASSRDALRRLAARLHLPDTDVPDDRIHLLTAAEFAEKVSERAHGKTSFGHVYVQRNQDLVDFSRVLTHELCHSASRYTLEVRSQQEARTLTAL